MAPQEPRPQAERFKTARAEFETALQPLQCQSGCNGTERAQRKAAPPGKRRPQGSRTFQAHEHGAAGGKSFNHKRTYHIAHGLTPSLEIC
ncbi:hypothetical protein COLSTE_01228 [Collinsella stercoris DSM 13279]|uniref:Uncharacterized protein n=1 Tax=Collinsella stercoris DSM 13279 TaxID=445975 RepID=B6GAX7_9ACTN|nr:hypothetical protein COLSTE_01228 [Collinsella stercoris DSM 13279]